MKDDRGNLSLTFCRIADKFQPDWVIWENVPESPLDKRQRLWMLFGRTLWSKRTPPAKRKMGQRFGLWAETDSNVACSRCSVLWSTPEKKKVFVLATPNLGDYRCAKGVIPCHRRLALGFCGGRKQRKTLPPPWKTLFFKPLGGRTTPSLAQSTSHAGGPGFSDQELFSQRRCLD